MTIEDIIDEYKKSLKKRNEIVEYNKKIKKRVRITHTLVALFFLCISYAYLNPQYIHGFHGIALEQQIQAEYAHLVATGWTDIREIQSYLQEYRENKQTSYVVLGKTVYRTDEISKLLLQSKWRVIIKPVIDVASLVYVFAKRGYASVAALFIFMKDSGNGVIRIQQLGDVAASGIWFFFLHFLYLSFLWFRGTIYRHHRPPIYNINNSDIVEYPILVRDDDNTQIVMFYDMVDIINHPVERINPPIIYKWIYGRLGIE